jgi:Caspase domain/Bacterial pre-peptidase C-terminal domain
MPQRVFVCLILLFGLLVWSANAAPEVRLALVIGNSAYPTAPLPNPVHDARLMSSTLKALGFTVVEAFNADQKILKRALQDFGERLERSGRDTVGLFYYAGHGIQVGGTNYLIPVDAAIARESDVEIEAVSAQAVLATLDYARNRLNLIIMDACRNNPYARSFRSAARGLARMDAPNGSLIAYATAPGAVAADGRGDNSPYTEALTRVMQEPGVPIEQVFKNARRAVMVETQNQQVPWESSSLTSDFYFISKEETGGEAGVPVAQGQIDREALFWRSIKDSGSREDFEEYLRQFPHGLFHELARKRLVDLSGASGTPPAPRVSTGATTSAPVSPPAPVQSARTETTAAPPEQTAEREPNNRLSEANVVAATSKTTGRIDPRGDVDWYRVSVSHHGELKVTVSNVPSNLDVQFRVWNQEREVITNWYTPLAKGGNTEGVVDIATAGDYYLEVHDGNDDANSPDPYTLALVFTPSIDIHEPNNAFGTAADVTPNQHWRATILPKGDVDWYRFTVDRQGEFRADITNVPANLAVQFRVWNAEGQVLSNWFTPLAVGGETHSTFDLPQPGTYLIEIRDGRDDARSVQPFEVTFAFTPSVDKGELNNSFGTATLLAPGQAITATILPRGDSDWYRVTVDEQGALDVAITNVPANLAVQFRIWNAERQVISDWYTPLAPGGDTKATVDLATGGSYVLEVRDRRDDARAIEPYTLQVTFTPTQDRSEPNNSIGTATPLKLGATVQGTILPKGDVDWYRVSTPRPGELVIHITNSPPNLDMIVRVWNADKQVLSQWFTPLAKGGNTTAKVGLPQASEYFLEVRDGGDDDRASAPYTLTTSMAP